MSLDSVRVFLAEQALCDAVNSLLLEMLRPLSLVHFADLLDEAAGPARHT